MPNIHETIKQREIEAGGPGSGRKPGGGWGDFGQGKTSNKRLGIKYDRMSDISHLTPHGHGFKPGNMYPHECAVCGYQKAQHKNGGPVKVKGLSAGGPGSGRHKEFGKFVLTHNHIGDHSTTKDGEWKSPSGVKVSAHSYDRKGIMGFKNKENGKTVFESKVDTNLDKNKNADRDLGRATVAAHNHLKKTYGINLEHDLGLD